MNDEVLLKEISSALTKANTLRLAKEVAVSSSSILYLLNASSNAPSPVAFRAAWILENVEAFYPECFILHCPKFIELYPLQQNNSCKRHYTKIMMNITGPRRCKLYATLLKENNVDDIVEATFTWLTDPKTPVAVQVNCMDVLFSLKHRYNWIADELKSSTEFLLKNGSAATQSRGKRILKKLR